MLKSKLCSLKKETPAVMIEDALTTVCNENLYDSQCRGFFNSMGRWLEKACQENHLFEPIVYRIVMNFL